MALETLRDVKSIGGFDVVDMNKIKDEHPEMFRPDGSMIYYLFDQQIRPFKFIYIRHDVNSISFNIQNGPVKEVGQNGCQVDTLIHTAIIMLEGLNKNFPCLENECAITNLKMAIRNLEDRKKDRETRGVEGLNKE